MVLCRKLVLRLEKHTLVTCKRLYDSIVLPTALYGCELWNDMTKQHIHFLEKAHSQCIKHMQSLPYSTRTIVALSSIAMRPLEYEIDKRKLLFFGQLCYVSETKMLKIMFIQRFVKFLNSPRNALGFMPDIYRIFGKYKLTKYLLDFAESATFPKLPLWKKIINRAITDHTNEEYRNRLIGDETLTKYLLFHSEYTPSNAWRFAQLYRDYLPYCKTLILLIGRLFSRKYLTSCPKCHIIIDDIVTHLVLFCINNNHHQDRLWCRLHTALGNKSYNALCQLMPEQQIIEIISGYPSLQITADIRVLCFKVTLIQLHKMSSLLRFINPG